MIFGLWLRVSGAIAVGGLLFISQGRAQQPTTADPGLTNSNQPGSETKAAPQPKPPEALSMPNANQLTRLDEAYLDVFNILKEDSPCSGFYGGPAAIVVLNRLKEQLEPVNLELNSTLGLRMSGKTITITSFPHRLTFRLFARAQINLAGPFYRSNGFPTGRSSIGGFPPNTREARVMILLHELGHLIQKQDQQWVLPDDGGNKHLSQQNTERVVAVCGKQINQLKGSSVTPELKTAGDGSIEANVPDK